MRERDEEVTLVKSGVSYMAEIANVAVRCTGKGRRLLGRQEF